MKGIPSRIGVAAVLLATAASAPAQTQPPNIVVVIADDLGIGDLGCYGGQSIATPRIDAMAQAGARFTSFYVAPSCSPTRAALLTGCLPPRVDVVSPQGSWSERGLAPSEVTIAEVLDGVGYRTGLFGKWHLGDSVDQLPVGQGFDESFGSPWGLPGRPHVLFDGGRIVETDGDPVGWTPRFVARTVDFIERAAHAGDPFFVVLAHTSPHQPATPSPGFVGTSADGREYGDSVEEIDASVGAVLDVLAASGVTSNTLVLFMSDNGPAIGQDPYQAGSSGGLRGAKGTTFEGGVRSPLVAHWPAAITPGATSDEILHVIDLFESFAALAAAPLSPSLPARDGVEASAVLVGGQGDPARALYLTRDRFVEAVRIGRYKLREGALYDLESDPAESTDIAAQLPGLVAQLEALRAAKAADLAAGRRSRALSTRRSPRWRADQGFTSQAPGNGDLWRASGSNAVPWRVIDFDSTADLEIVPTGASVVDLLPGAALRVPSYAPRLALVRDGGDLGVTERGRPFALELWFRSASDAPQENSVLFDAGDEDAGVSVTVGDAGLIGDDGGPGQRDDLVMRIGGATSAESLSMAVDLPSGAGGWADRFTHLVFTIDAAGRARLTIDGIRVARAIARSVDAGLDGVWALAGRHRGLGGDGGPGLRPFDGSSFVGEIALIRMFDRTLAAKEAELLLARHVAYAYCAPLPNAAGRRASFDLVGDFRSASRRLFVRMSGAGQGAIGRIFASPSQSRTALAAGFLCLDSSGLVALPPFQVGAPWNPPVELGPAFTFDPGSTPTWNFQLWIREGGQTSFSNALRILFAP
ncbi:MAG: sulfatase-like hydrolase/transferase [Planctomycetota bacterium]